MGLLPIRALTEAGCRGMRPCEIAYCVEKCLATAQYPLEELTGQAGDVVIMHPFLIHARSKNLGKYVCVNLFCEYECYVTNEYHLLEVQRLDLLMCFIL